MSLCSNNFPHDLPPQSPAGVPPPHRIDPGSPAAGVNLSPSIADLGHRSPLLAVQHLPAQRSPDRRRRTYRLLP